jgi:hypothetical protein
MGRIPKNKTMVIPDEPITHEMVLKVLSTMVLKSSALPEATDPAIKRLANFLEMDRKTLHNIKGSWRKEKERLDSVKEAVRLLAKELPRLRKDYDARLKIKAARRRKSLFLEWSKEDLKETKVDLVVLDFLISAASYFQIRGFSYSTIEIGLAEASRGTPEKWTYFAGGLIKEFHKAIPSVSKSKNNKGKTASYKFVAAVTKLITGEEIDWKTVRRQIMREREEHRKALANETFPV